MTDLIPSQNNQEVIIPANLLEGYTEYFEVASRIIAQLDSKQSQKTYASDVRVFWRWMYEQSITPRMVDRNDMGRFRTYLNEKYAVATAQRLWSVTSHVLQEYVNSQLLTHNPATGFKKFKSRDETPYTALSLEEAKEFVGQVDQSTKMGKRDYCILLLLIRVGLRRQECTTLTLGDLQRWQGYYVLTVLGKGNERATVKLPIDVYEAIYFYLEACDRKPFPMGMAAVSQPLFVGFDRGDHPTLKRMNDKVIYRIVQKYVDIYRKLRPDLGSKVSTHAMRATAITLWLEGGASLHQAQYAARHKDPRTTERYQKRKLNLVDNAVDKVKW
jgi:site-specific recombinase XerD